MVFRCVLNSLLFRYLYLVLLEIHRTSYLALIRLFLDRLLCAYDRSLELDLKRGLKREREREIEIRFFLRSSFASFDWGFQLIEIESLLHVKLRI